MPGNALTLDTHAAQCSPDVILLDEGLISLTVENVEPGSGLTPPIRALIRTCLPPLFWTVTASAMPLQLIALHHQLQARSGSLPSPWCLPNEG
jgi:hypothetical protein